MKRILIEVMIIVSVLLLCMLYGAVTVRDAQSTPAPSTGPALTSINQTETHHVEKQMAINQDPHAKSDKGNPGLLKAAGESFSDKVSRIFLWSVGMVAGIVQGLIQSFI
ncbi:hypothetical protein EWI07_10660 [Sporolactobacillus sp. THM7-4]|nr:hypothetical protein EWI07_10660 [Sporolactobacillus sp. THM7-4]